MKRLPVVNVLKCTRSRSASRPRLKKPLIILLLYSIHRKRESHPEDTGRFHPCREVWLQPPAGPQKHGCEHMCFYDDVGIYCMYVFTVTIYRRKNQNYSSLLTFSKTSYRKESLNLSYKPSNRLLPKFLSVGGVLLLAGTDHQLSPNLIFSQPSVSLIYMTGIVEDFADE